MDRNLKILDKFDRDANIYGLISELSERAHEILGGAIASGKKGMEDHVVESVMEERLMPLPQELPDSEQEES